MAGNPLAKLQWVDPVNSETREFILTEGATATIGRSSNNDIPIPEQHVSRQHAVINYRDGIFMVNDLGSSNGTFVNDQKVDEPFPLFAGDEIRLYVPTVRFLAIDGAEEVNNESDFVIVATDPKGQGTLVITNGPQEGQNINLMLDSITIGRATSSATWEVLLQDPSVSRPHARLDRHDDTWFITDLGSSNGTRINKQTLNPNQEKALADGDTLELGSSILLFRTGWESPGNDGLGDTGAAGATGDITLPNRNL